MEITLLVARLLLAGVFLIAGISKLTDPAGTRKAIVNFGLPTALAAPLGRVLPWAELATAVALVSVSSAWQGALAALSLLVLFSVVIGINLFRGRRPDCHCFGQIHSEPIGGRTLMRNGIFAAAAGFIVSQGHDEPGPSVIAFLSGITPGQAMMAIVGIVLLLILAGQGWFVIHLSRQNGRLLLRMEKVEARLAALGVAQTTHMDMET